MTIFPTIIWSGYSYKVEYRSETQAWLLTFGDIEILIIVYFGHIYMKFFIRYSPQL